MSSVLLRAGPDWVVPTYTADQMADVLAKMGLTRPYKMDVVTDGNCGVDCGVRTGMFESIAEGRELFATMTATWSNLRTELQFGASIKEGTVTDKACFRPQRQDTRVWMEVDPDTTTPAGQTAEKAAKDWCLLYNQIDSKSGRRRSHLVRDRKSYRAHLLK